MIDPVKELLISTIVLKQFRCFDTISIDLDSPIVLICGSNGTGKTSLLEALYYACYLRSFRTHSVRDLIGIDKESFFIKLTVRDASVEQSLYHTINIGFAQNKRLVKINNISTVSYKDLLSYYRVISLTEDDLSLIKGGPEDRRIFLDQALLLHNISFMPNMREFRAILEQRNSLLQQHYIDKDAYFIWTQKLWDKTRIIQDMRKKILHDLELEINTMLASCFGPDVSLSFSYAAKKKSDCPFEDFWAHHESLLKEEQYFKRSLFGVHLDDFNITLEGKKSRSFASRGQQKMIVLLIKVAQIRYLMHEKGSPVIFLLDDFMTDFDQQRGAALLSILFGMKCQLIFTSPHQNSPLEEVISHLGYSFKKISI